MSKSASTRSRALTAVVPVCMSNTLLPPPAATAAAVLNSYQQCGGLACMTALYGTCGDWPWSGARCAANHICTKHTPYYWQCLPIGDTYSQGTGQPYSQGTGLPYSQGTGQAYSQGTGQAYSQGTGQPSSSAISGIARGLLLPAARAGCIAHVLLPLCNMS